MLSLMTISIRVIFVNYIIVSILQTRLWFLYNVSGNKITVIEELREAEV